MQTPNHSQIDRIAGDIRKLTAGKIPTNWKGNSYRGTVSNDGTVYGLFHWSTLIAAIRNDGQITHFDATFYSMTTRHFQSRIVSALSRALGDSPRLSDVLAELAKPTDQRTSLGWED